MPLLLKYGKNSFHKLPDSKANNLLNYQQYPYFMPLFTYFFHSNCTVLHLTTLSAILKPIKIDLAMISQNFIFTNALEWLLYTCGCLTEVETLLGSMNWVFYIKSSSQQIQLTVYETYDVKPASNCFRVTGCLNSSLEKIQLAYLEASFSLLEINLLLLFDLGI